MRETDANGGGVKFKICEMCPYDCIMYIVHNPKKRGPKEHDPFLTEFFCI